MEPKILNLPIGVVSDSDLDRLVRELEGLNDFFLSAAARKSGTPIQPPRVTRALNSIASDRQSNLLDEAARKKLSDELKTIRTNAPLMHISFATEPSPKVLERILIWLRTNIHPYTLLQVGLQPTIAAGCVLRTPNKIFDMSLRSYLDGQKGYLVELVKGAVQGE